MGAWHGVGVANLLALYRATHSILIGRDDLAPTVNMGASHCLGLANLLTFAVRRTQFFCKLYNSDLKMNYAILITKVLPRVVARRWSSMPSASEACIETTAEATSLFEHGCVALCRLGKPADLCGATHSILGGGLVTLPISYWIWLRKMSY